MEFNQELWAQVEAKVRDKVAEVDSSRSKSLIDTFAYGIFLGLALTLTICCLAGTFHFYFFLISFGIGWIIFGIYYHHKRNQQYKAQVMPIIVDAICPGAIYSPEGTLSMDIIKSSRLYDCGWCEKFNNEDTIRGKVDKTEFAFGEVELYHMQHTGKTTVKVTDFKGFVFEADFNKYFNGTTLLSSEKIRLATHLGLFSDLSRCKLENVRFEDEFRTYTNNDQEARYLLTPALQERILNMFSTFKSQLGSRDMSISFHDNCMLIMVPSNTDRFEVKYSVEEVKKDFFALQMMIDIVEHLNLNLRIWTKE